ncbi:hypothetical protein FPRO04_09834 [Fusarium proliferatum]|nr:hypothetical protein FPRO04_09834 [Fusarium proliferatum]
MSSKAEILQGLANVGFEKEHLEREIKAAEDYTKHITQQKMDKQAIVYGSYDQATKDAAQKEYDYYCDILSDLLDKALDRERRMQELRDEERRLFMLLRSER